MLELRKEPLEPVALSVPFSGRCEYAVTEVSLPGNPVSGGK
jgi:hypothetical protein